MKDLAVAALRPRLCFSMKPHNRSEAPPSDPHRIRYLLAISPVAAVIPLLSIHRLVADYCGAMRLPAHSTDPPVPPKYGLTRGPPPLRGRPPPRTLHRWRPPRAATRSAISSRRLWDWACSPRVPSARFFLRSHAAFS